MSGHANFAPIGHNLPPVQGGVPEPVAPQPAPQPQPPAEVEPPVADGRLPTEALLRELDVMLAKAASASAEKGVDAEGLARTARAAKISADAAEKLRAAARTAQEKMRALDAFNGAQLADAMRRFEDEDGNAYIDWDPLDDAGKAIKEALEAQEKLSKALAEQINALPAKATAQQQAALEEAMLQCDRRISEIETIVMQVTEIAERHIDGQEIDEATQARLGRKLVDLAGEQSLQMHDRTRALEALHAGLDPLVRKLDGYAAHGTDTVTKADLRTLTREIDQARNALAAAAKSGKVVLDGREIFVDRTFLDEAAKAVDAAKRKLDDLRENVGRAAVRKFIDNDMPWPWKDDDVLKPEFADNLESLGPDVAPLAALVRKVSAVRTAMLDLVDNPKYASYSAAWDAAEAITSREVRTASAAIAALFNKSGAPAPNLPAPFRKALEGFARRCVDEPEHLNALCKSVKNHLDSLSLGVEHAYLMACNAKKAKEEAFLASGALRDVFRGERTFTSLVESRLHGYDDADIDPTLDDRNVESSRELGSGAMNSVSLVTFKGGRQAVFKPEVAGRFSATVSPLQAGLAPQQQMTRVNVAVQKTADALGLGDVMVKTTAGTHKGVFGMFMDMAPGVEGDAIRRRVRIPAGPGGVKTTLSAIDIGRLSDADYEKVAGRLMRQFNRLEWFDLLTGQGDRHVKNYLVQVRPDLTVEVKGIDNDASFGVFRTGLHKFVLSDDRQIRRFENALTDYATSCGPDNKDAVLAALNADPAVQRRRDGTIEIDLSRTTNPAFAEIVCHKALGGQTFTVPDAIDRELCDRLVALKSGAPRRAYLADLKSRLGAAQYKAAVSRLDEAIAHAEKLRREGKVYDAAQWETREVQRTVAALGSRLKELPPVAGARPRPAFEADFLREYNYTMAPTVFGRDMIPGIGRKNWFQ